MRKTITSLILVVAMLTLALNSMANNMQNANPESLAVAGTSVMVMTAAERTDEATAGTTIGDRVNSLGAGVTNSSNTMENTISTLGAGTMTITLNSGFAWDGGFIVICPTQSSINNTMLVTDAANNTAANLGDGTSLVEAGVTNSNLTANAEDADQDNNPAPQDNDAGRTDAANTPTNKTENG